MMNCAQTDGLLDALLDDALEDSERAALEDHCASCATCAEKLQAAQMLKRLLKETEPEMDVPLAAQAAWRGAVRAEAQKRRRTQWTRWAGGIAAALVVAVGGFFALREPRNAPLAAIEKSVATAGAAMENVAVIEADGQAFEAIDTAVSRSVPQTERRMTVEDLDRTCAYMADLAREYEGTLEERRYEADGARFADLYVELPADNAADFLAAAAHYDLNGASEEPVDVEEADSRVSMLLILEERA